MALYLNQNFMYLLILTTTCKCSLTVVLMNCFLCCISLGQSSAIGSPVLVPFSRWSSEPSLAHCSPDSCPHSSSSMAQSSTVSALPHRMASSFPDHPIPIPLRRSESVGRRNLLRHPNPLPPLLTNRDSDYELEPPDRGRKRAIDNQYMFFWQRQRMKKNKRSRRWKVLQNSWLDGEHPAAKRRKDLESCENAHDTRDGGTCAWTILPDTWHSALPRYLVNVLYRCFAIKPVCIVE